MITEQLTVTLSIAGAEVNDEYMVELHTPESVKHRTVLSPEQAQALAEELVSAARDAEHMMRSDRREQALRAVRHGFDIDGPVAR